MRLDRPGQRRLPTVVAGEVAAVPLGADVVQLAQQPLAEQFHRVVVEDAVMALVAGGQQAIGLLGRQGHLLALVDGVAHELLGDDVQPGLHGGDGHRGVQVQRQGDDHRFQLVVLGVLDQLLVVAVDLDFLAGGVFGLPARRWPSGRGGSSPR